MEVILREELDKLGQRGSIVKVADGYARNYLLPKRLAVLATDANRKIVEQERQAWLRKEAKIKRRRGSCQAANKRHAHVPTQSGRKRSAIWLGYRPRHR